MLAVLAVLLSLTACAGKQKKAPKGPAIPPGPVIKDVEVEGVALFEEEEGKFTLKEGSDVHDMVVNGKMALEDAQVPYVLDLIAEFTTQILERDELLNEALGIKNESGDGEDGESATAEEDETETPEENTASDDDETTNGEGGENGGGDGSGSDGGDGEAGGGDEPKKIDINVGALITRRIAQKDRIIGRQLNYILHAEKFQKLEASWRGLFHLVSNSEIKRKQLELKLLNVSFDDLYKDLDKAVDFDQSALFKIIYEDEYGTYGGDPYSVLIGDYELGRTSQHIQFLEMISKVAAAAHAPFIASAYAKLFDLEDFEALYKPRDLSKIFDSAELIRWRSFRESEDSRYVTLTLPKVMLRLPYDMEDNPVEGIFFNEDFARTVYKKDKAKQEIVAFDSIELETVDGVQVEKKKKQVDPRKMLWGNPAYVLAQRITNAFALHGWTAAIRGVEGGGLVEGLPDFTFDTEDGDIALQCPTQVSITDRREKELNDLGFMAICHCKGTNKAAFFGGQTTNKPKQYLKDIATKNAQISSMLPYMMAASRFAHYIKVLMREKIGSFQTRQAVQDYLNTWISQYVLLDDTPPQAIKAKFPLREANVVVVDVPGKVGAYRATVFLRPHFQLEELTTSIRLVAELPSG